MKCYSRAASALRPSVIAGAIAAAAVSVVLALGTTPSQAYAVTSSELQAEAQEVLAQIEAMQQTLDEISAQYFQALAEYQTAVECQEASQARIDELTGEIAEVQSRLNERAREMYRNGSATELDLLLGSASFEEFTTNWDFLNRMNTSDANLTIRAKELRAQAEAEKTEYGRLADVASKKSQEAATAYAEAEELIAQMEETYNSLSAEAQELYMQEQAAAAAAAAAQAQAAAQSYSGGYVNDDGTVTDAQTGQTYASASEYSAATGNAVVDRAYAMLGSSYVWGGVGGSSGGFDCSGLVSYALTGQNTRLGTTATFSSWNQVSDPQPGDVCVIHNDSSQHTGIYIGNGQMIHAADYGTGVVVGDVQDGMIYVRQ
jgi:cell wall-associated NlpC family hydrolase